ncbi:hypothetical protein IW262DRAFT_1389242 [Armillaria fumosa]|nr:hypothetical protein IW262DRAFT_1389242 [Armillaria fumosa]
MPSSSSSNVMPVIMAGGSSGLGLALASRLVKLGPHVSIVARNKKLLQEAIKKIEVVHSYRFPIIE